LGPAQNRIAQFGIIVVRRSIMQLESSRPANGSFGMNLLKAVFQTLLVWGVFLWLIPELLVRLEMAAAIPTFAADNWSTLGLVLFMASSTVFLICLWNIVWMGNGTPWPWDERTGFVVAGPYRYLRNPIVVAAIGQGLASALILGSYFGFVYLVIGFLAWNFVLRPAEEADLSHRFGQSYTDYLQSVPSYFPMLHPYRSMIIESVPDDPAKED
jgi:protein-S-isoprenylcysteine O-methyltransferase Ste14